MQGCWRQAPSLQLQPFPSESAPTESKAWGGLGDLITFLAMVSPGDCTGGPRPEDGVEEVLHLLLPWFLDELDCVSFGMSMLKVHSWL